MRKPLNDTAAPGDLAELSRMQLQEIAVEIRILVEETTRNRVRPGSDAGAAEPTIAEVLSVAVGPLADAHLPAGVALTGRRVTVVDPHRTAPLWPNVVKPPRSALADAGAEGNTSANALGGRLTQLVSGVPGAPQS